MSPLKPAKRKELPSTRKSKRKKFSEGNDNNTKNDSDIDNKNNIKKKQRTHYHSSGKNSKRKTEINIERKESIDLEDDEGFTFIRKPKPSKEVIQSVDAQKYDDDEDDDEDNENNKIVKKHINMISKSNKVEETINNQLDMKEEKDLIDTQNNEEIDVNSTGEILINENNHYEDIISTRSIPIPISDTPIIRRNQLLRQLGSRRSSLGKRGKRASSIGNGTQIDAPPNLDSSSFYKHIDSELPEPHRMKQLLIWSAKRAIDTINKNDKITSNENTKSLFKNITGEVLQGIQDGVISTSWWNIENSNSETKQKKIQENPLNILNREKLQEYTQKLEDLKREKEEWLNFNKLPEIEIWDTKNLLEANTDALKNLIEESTSKNTNKEVNEAQLHLENLSSLHNPRNKNKEKNNNHSDKTEEKRNVDNISNDVLEGLDENEAERLTKVIDSAIDLPINLDSLYSDTHEMTVFGKNVLRFSQNTLAKISGAVEILSNGKENSKTPELISNNESNVSGSSSAGSEDIHSALRALSRVLPRKKHMDESEY